MSNDNIIKNIGPNTYKDALLSITAQRIVFVIYHIMNLRNGDYMPNVDSLNAVAYEHGIHDMSLEDLIAYERWLNMDFPALGDKL